jgi:acid phosphatase class B
MEGLSNLAMKPGESTSELLPRITNTMVIINDSYASYENKPPAPADFDVNNGFTMPVCWQWKDDVLNNTQQFLKMQLFWAALMPELRKVVAQRNLNTMTLDDMYQIVTDTQCEAGPKIKQAVAAVQPENDDDEIAAFHRRKNKNFNQKKTAPSASSSATAKSGFKGYSGNYKSNTGPGNNTNRNGKYCFYCKLQNHTQDECFKRI